jgi:hypothetical protein
MKSVSNLGRAARTVACLALFGIAPGCYDKNDLCGPLMEASPDGLLCNCVENATVKGNTCECIETAFPNKKGECELCPDGEVGTKTGCDCAPGLTRNDDGDCEGAKIGATCASDGECTADFPHCELPAGYCTKLDCADSAECGSTGYACMPVAGDNTQTYCRRAPTGLAKACTSADDCAGTEATYCNPFTSLCDVENCNLAANDCYDGFVCCDLSAFGTPQPICTPPAYCAN